MLCMMPEKVISRCRRGRRQLLLLVVMELHPSQPWLLCACWDQLTLHSQPSVHKKGIMSVARRAVMLKLFEACERLLLPISTTITALITAHRYIDFISMDTFLEKSENVQLAAICFLSCKVVRLSIHLLMRSACHCDVSHQWSDNVCVYIFCM